jgi:endonuclease G
MRSFIKSALLPLFLLVPFSGAAAPSQQPAPLPVAQCQQFLPYGTPVAVGTADTALICRNAYVLLSDENNKVPRWVAYTLAPEHAIGCVERSNAFAADQSLPKGKRADPKDYVASGFDIGHMAPDGDMSWDDGVEHQSFILTNMSPQLGHLNRGIWKLLESDVRAWDYQRHHTELIYVGPIYDPEFDPTIGDDKVIVPHAFFKIVIDMETKETLAFIFQKEGVQGNDLTPLQRRVADIEALTSITFPLPPGVKDTDSPAPLWPVSLGAFTKAKKAQCHGKGD